MKPSIKILVCYHKKFPLLKDEILTPIHLGRAGANKESEVGKWLMKNMIGDDTGENISDKNSYYNEMTALYWAWKNYEELGNPDYIGLAHYRRHFVLEENVEKTYSIRKYDENNILEALNYTPEKMYEIVDGCDFVTHLGRVYNCYEHYVDNQRKDDIDVALEIMEEKFPEYKRTAEEYMAGQVSNFYNMNIFSKELFFKYCEFVFSIMEEFEVRMPSVCNRRMFISERLTAIFMKKLMDDEQYKYKFLPVAFIDEPLDVNIAMYVSNENVSSMAVSIQSILRYSNSYNKYVFYVIHNGTLKREYIECLTKMIERKAKCELKISVYKGGEKGLPLLIPFLLPKLNKCLLITKSVVALSDFAEFYRLCVVDDYYVSGVPEITYNQRDREKKIVEDMMMLNCKRIRNNETFVQYLDCLEHNENGMSVLNEQWKDEINYIAHYWYVSERLRGIGSHIYHRDISRNQLQIEAKWCPVILFDDVDPIINSQGIYAKYWWENYQDLPTLFKDISYNTGLLEQVWKRQLDEIWLKANYGIVKYPGEETQINDQPVTVPVAQQQTEVVEEWRNYGLWGKLKFYYQHNGKKQTVKYVVHKVFGGKENSLS